MTERDWTGLDRNRRDGKGMDCAGQKRSERDVARRGGAGENGTSFAVEERYATRPAGQDLKEQGRDGQGSH